jgi:hypothetical protein
MQEDNDHNPQESGVSEDRFKEEKGFSCKDFIVVDDRARITLLKSTLF